MKAPAVPLLAAALLAVAAPAALASPDAIPPWWPAAPTALAAAATLLVVAWVALVLPSTRHAGPVVVLESLCVVAPLAAALRCTSAGPVAFPWTFVATGLGLGVLACGLRPPWRGRCVALAACVLVGLPALANAGVVSARATPSALTAATAFARLAPPTAPLDVLDALAGLEHASAADQVPSPWRDGDPKRALRVGSMARTPPPSAWPRGAPPGTAARWIPVPDGALTTLPRAAPVARFVGGTPAPPGALENLGIAAVPTGMPAAPLADPRDLDACDLVVLGTDAPDDPATAVALAGFVRRGGLLVGPAKGTAWPASIVRRLGLAAVEDEGPAAARGLDAGHVARAASPAAFASLLAAGLHRPRVTSVFHRALVAPSDDSGFRTAPSDSPPPQTPIGIAVAATALLGVVAAITQGRRRTAWLAALAAVGAAEPFLAAAADAGPTLDAAVMELGGAGARRVDVVLVTAGPSGWVAPSDPVAEADGLSVLGFAVVRVGGAWRLALAPGASGWVVADRIASGAIDDATAVESPPSWAMALLEQPSGGGRAGRAGHVSVGTSRLGIRWESVIARPRVRAVALRFHGG